MFSNLRSFPFLICLALFFPASKYVHAHEPLLQLSVAGGYAGLSGSITEAREAPYGYGSNGGFLAFSGQYKILASWKCVAEVVYQANTYRVTEAAGNILLTDPKAISAKVEAGAYQMLTLAAGPSYEIKCGRTFLVTLSVVAGFSTLYSPRITEKVKTVPHTQTIYESGRASAFYMGATLRPVWLFKPNIGLGLLLSTGYAHPHIRAEQMYSLEHQVWRAGLELHLKL